jgi:ribosomal protein S18 acetylase RimI-like enzyme
MPDAWTIRHARLADLEAICALERAGFSDADSFSRRALRHYVTEAHATTLVLETGGGVRGYAIMGWRAKSSVGNLYSIVTDPACRGQGFGARLLEACEAATARRGRAAIALDVRAANEPAIHLYRRHGYAVIATKENYYGDGSPALRMRKKVPPLPPAASLPLPHYQQALEHDGAPACLLMALGWPERDATLEQALWREAAARPRGQCSPLGMAIAARRRGREAHVIERARDSTPGLASLATGLGVRRALHHITFESIAGALRDGLAPILRGGAPDAPAHRWAVVAGFDAERLTLHDPSRAVPASVPLAEFRRSLSDGSSGALVLVGTGS